MQCPMFVTREEWKTHLRSEHPISKYWECLVCTDAENSITFPQADEFLSHMQSMHSAVIADIESPRLLEMSLRESLLTLSTCPLCVSPPMNADADPETLLDHIGDHMYNFSLQSLPWMDTTESDSQAHMSSETVAKIDRWFNEVVPSVDAEVEHDPPYPFLETIRDAIAFNRGPSIPIQETYDVCRKQSGHTDPDQQVYFAETDGASSRAQPDTEQALTDHSSGSDTEAFMHSNLHETSNLETYVSPKQLPRATEMHATIDTEEDPNETRIAGNGSPDKQDLISSKESPLDHEFAQLDLALLPENSPQEILPMPKRRSSQKTLREDEPTYMPEDSSSDKWPPEKYSTEVFGGSTFEESTTVAPTGNSTDPVREKTEALNLSPNATAQFSSYHLGGRSSMRFNADFALKDCQVLQVLLFSSRLMKLVKWRTNKIPWTLKDV